VDDSLSIGMHWLNSEYSKAFNDRHGRVGYLVRDRFRYVVGDPVRAGIVDRAAEWP
jgi:hypothetical protein